MVSHELAVIQFLTPSGTHISLLYAQFIQNLELEHAVCICMPNIYSYQWGRPFNPFIFN